MEDKHASDDKEKSLYLTQIRHLDEQLERCQLRCDELQKQNKHLTSQCRALREDKDDIAEYLKHSAAAEDKKVEELMEQLQKQQHKAEEDKEGLKLQHRQRMEELQEETDKLKSKSRTQVVVLQELNEQLEEQLQLLDSLPIMESLEKQLSSEKVEQATILINMEEEIKQERKRICDDRRSAVKRYLQIKIPECLEVERSEHGELLQKVEKLLEEDIELWRKIDKLETSNRMLNSEIDSLEKNTDEVNHDISKYKKEVEELLTAKQRLEAKKEQWSIIAERMLGEEEELRQIMASLLEEYSQKEAEVDQLEVKILQERSRRCQLEADMEEAATILGHLLTDPEEMTETHKKIQRLLEILESPASWGTGPAPDDPTKEGSKGEKLQTSGREPARAETLNLATDPQFLMVRYRPGDFGFVPRPTWKHRTGSSARTKSRRRLGQTSASVDPSGPHQLTDPEGGASADH